MAANNSSSDVALGAYSSSKDRVIQFTSNSRWASLRVKAGSEIKGTRTRRLSPKARVIFLVRD
jgi:hypothetical protein